MFILSSLKTCRDVPWTLAIIMLINIALLGEPTEAIKCYRCTCWSDCVLRKHLFHEMECPQPDNACLTRLPTSETENYIAKQCWISPNTDVTEDRTHERGKRIYKYCYTDLCNDEEAGGIKNPNPRADSNGATTTTVPHGKITDCFFVAAVMIIWVHWLLTELTD